MNNNSSNNTDNTPDTTVPLSELRPKGRSIEKELLGKTLSTLEVAAVFDDMTIQVRSRSTPRTCVYLSSEEGMIKDFIDSFNEEDNNSTPKS